MSNDIALLFYVKLPINEFLTKPIIILKKVFYHIFLIKMK
jgi:hypothetical protein